MNLLCPKVPSVTRQQKDTMKTQFSPKQAFGAVVVAAALLLGACGSSSSDSAKSDASTTQVTRAKPGRAEAPTRMVGEVLVIGKGVSVNGPNGQGSPPNF